MASAFSNIVSFTLPVVREIESIQAGGDFIAGAIAAFLPPVGNAVESIQAAGDFLGAVFTSVDPFFADVVLLTPLDGANNATAAPDLSPVGNTLTFVGGAKLTTVNPEFGSASLLTVDGFLNAITMPVTPAGPLDLNDTDFTVEFWVNINAVGASPGFEPLVSAINGSFGSGWEVRFSNSFGNRILGFFLFGAGASPGFVTPTTQGVWHAVAAVRQGNIADLWLDGVSAGPEIINGSLGPAAALLSIAGAPLSSHSLNGQIDEVRITKGIARYTPGVPYTPAVAPFPTS